MIRGSNRLHAKVAAVRAWRWRPRRRGPRALHASRARCGVPLLQKTPVFQKKRSVIVMEVWTALAIAGAGFVAGIVNAIAGAGTIITFPTLVALGYPPIVANVSNTVGILPASITAVLGFRRELRGHWRSVSTMAVFSAVGGIAGALILLFLPSATFSAVVPVLLVVAAVLAAAQPRVARFVQGKASVDVLVTRPVTAGLAVGVFLTGIYGGYFGAAQGVILLAVLGVLWSPDLHRSNGAKNVLAGTAGVFSAAVFGVSALVDWGVVAVIAVSSALGGYVGSRVGRRIPAGPMRMILIVISLLAAAYLVIF